MLYAAVDLGVDPGILDVLAHIGDDRLNKFFP